MNKILCIPTRANISCSLCFLSNSPPWYNELIPIIKIATVNIKEATMEIFIYKDVMYVAGAWMHMSDYL